MKLNSIYVLLLGLIGMFLSSCDKKEPSLLIQEYDVPKQVFLESDENQDMLIFSAEDLNETFGENSSYFKNIDFKKYNFLYIQGVNSRGIHQINKSWSFEPDSDSASLLIEIDSDYTTEMSPWQLGFLIPKQIEKVNINIVKDNRQR